MDNEKYINLFVDESRENLLALNEYLLELEKGAGDLKILNDIFRVAHTLKGMSATMGFSSIADLTHEMENLLDFLRNAQLAVTVETIDVLFLCLDALEILVENVVSNNNREVDTINLMYRLKKLIKIGSGEDEVEEEVVKVITSEDRDIYNIFYSEEDKKSIKEAVENGYSVSEIEVVLMKDCVMKSIRVILILQAVENKAKIIKSTPQREDLNNEKFGRSFIITIIHSTPIEEIKEAVLSIAEVMKVYSEDLKEKFKDTLKLAPNKPKKVPTKNNSIIDYTDVEKNVLIEALNQKFKCYEIYISLMQNTIMKAIRVAMVLNSLTALDCQMIKSIPSNNELLSDDVPNNFILTIISDKKEDEIKNNLLSIAEITQVEILEILKPYLQPEEEESEKNFVIPVFNNYENLLISEASNVGKRVLFIGINLMSGTIMKFARYVLVSRKLETIGEIIKTIPSTEEIESEKFDNSFQIVFVTNKEDKVIKDAISSVAEITNIVDLIPIVETEKHTIPKEESKIEFKQIEEKITKIEKNEKYLIDTSNNQDIDKKSSKKQSIKKPTIRVDIDRLDELINLIEEVIIFKSSLTKISANLKVSELTQAVRGLNLISTNLQNNAMKLRMVPVEHIFNRFPRMVRDLTKNLNKEIDFVIDGEETELDRTIIDEIGDPLVHLLRNSVDHGIESPNTRIEAGKNKVGKINLIARHEGNNVLIIVEDDGGGINVERVKAKAIEKKIITPEQAKSMSHEEALNIVFLPGFSTVEQTTDISGRGVGMDAVLSKVKSIGGNITITSEQGKGSRFTIKLPLTLAIIDVLLVNLLKETYAVPISYIEEVREIFPEEIKNVNKVKVIMLREQTIPLVYLSEVLNVKQVPKEETPYYDQELQTIPIVIVRTEEGKKTSALVVDNIIGQEDVVIKPLGKIALDRRNYVSGTANLGDGNLALILNVTNLT